MISLKLLRGFWTRRQDADRLLRAWYRTALHATWSDLSDVRLVYPHAVAVRTARGDSWTAFNSGGDCLAGSGDRAAARDLERG